MSAVTLVLGWAVGAVMMVAGGGKLLSEKTFSSFSLGVAELLLGVLLWSGMFRLQVAILMIGVAAAYCVYALTRSPEQRCACFGRHLPSTGAAGQRIRNALLLLLTLAYAVGVSRSGHMPPAMPILAGSLGLALGASVIVGPWLAEWIAQPLHGRNE